MEPRLYLWLVESGYEAKIGGLKVRGQCAKVIFTFIARSPTAGVRYVLTKWDTAVD